MREAKNAINSAAGAKNYLFGGWLPQKDLSPKLTLGGEFFAQGTTMEGEQTSTRGLKRTLDAAAHTGGYPG